MDAEQKKFLQDRFRKAVVDQPELKHLNTMLLAFGGVLIVAPSGFDPDISSLLVSGFVMSGQVNSRKMRSNLCHQNNSVCLDCSTFWNHWDWNWLFSERRRFVAATFMGITT
jgi:hypothetical protein